MYTAFCNTMTHHCATNMFAAVSSCANIVILDIAILAVSIILLLGSTNQAVKTRCKLQ